MQHVYYLLLRRLRTPIITIIVVYAISVLGFTLIPGQGRSRQSLAHGLFMLFISLVSWVQLLVLVKFLFLSLRDKGLGPLLRSMPVLSPWLYGIGTIFTLFQG